MGRQPYLDRKTKVEEATALSIFKLNEWGLLNSNCHTQLNRPRQENAIGLTIDLTGKPHVLLSYTVTLKNGNKADYKYSVCLTKSQCYFGGVRYWFICPNCRRQSAKLYFTNDNGQFGCRICNHLTYESTVLPRFMRPGGMGYWLTVHRKTKEINVKRHTWGGMPTRKMHRIAQLKEKSIVKPKDILSFLNHRADRQV